MLSTLPPLSTLSVTLQQTRDGHVVPEPVPSTQVLPDVHVALNSYRAASPLELKGSYKRMALLLHPDKNPSEQAVGGFKRVQDAYDTLSDALRRAEYDAELDTGGPRVRLEP